MNTHQQDLLLEEYKSNVALGQHDDNLRQQRTGHYLTANTILLVVLSALLSIKPTIYGLSIAVILLSIFGLSISFIWYSILGRNAEYIKFRRFQLRYLESKLPPMTTFTAMHEAFSQCKTIKHKNHDEEFYISKRCRKSSASAEGRLPIIIIIFWIIVLLAGLFVLIFPPAKLF